MSKTKTPYLHGESNIRDHLLGVRREKAVEWVRFAVRTKLIPPAKTLKCVDCGKQAYCYDHRDYTKPKKVAPVCGSCQWLRGPGKPYPTSTNDLRKKYSNKQPKGFHGQSVFTIEIKASGSWRKTDATIDEHGWARVQMPFPYGIELFKKWRPIKAKRNARK